VLTWWRTQSWSIEIAPVQVVKVSEKTIITRDERLGRDRRTNILGEYERYFPSWEEARRFLMDRETKQVERARRQEWQASQNYNKLFLLGGQKHERG